MKKKKLTESEQPVETAKDEETPAAEHAEETVKSKKSSKKKKGKHSASDADPSDAEKTSAEGAASEKKGDKKYNYLISNRSVRKQARKRNVALFMTAFIAVTVVLGAIVYGISLMIQHNNLKILIDKAGSNVLSLSSSAAFNSGSEVLALGGPRYMDNVSLVDFYPRVEEIRATEGAYKPDESKFLAATFFLKNVTDKPQTYSEAVALREVTQNLDSAMRVMLVKEKNGEVSEEVYAKAVASDGGSAYDENAIPEEVCPKQFFGRNGKFVESEEDVWFATPFVSSQYALYRTENHLAPGEVVKYSVIVWLEGWDKDCVDARLGGTIRLELQFIQS